MVYNCLVLQEFFLVATVKKARNVVSSRNIELCVAIVFRFCRLLSAVCHLKDAVMMFALYAAVSRFDGFTVVLWLLALGVVVVFAVGMVVGGNNSIC